MAKWWFSGDHHFSHGNILEYCGRPFRSTAHMDMELVRRWNDRVKEGDKVLYLGDFAFGDPQRFIEQLNGDIIFIKGSHDGEIKTILRSCVIHYGGIDFYCSHEPEPKFKFNLCAHVHEKWKIKRVGPKVMINCGVDQWNFYPIDINEILKFLTSEGVKTGRCGHCGKHFDGKGVKNTIDGRERLFCSDECSLHAQMGSEG